MQDENGHGKVTESEKKLIAIGFCGHSWNSTNNELWCYQICATEKNPFINSTSHVLKT